MSEEKSVSAGSLFHTLMTRSQKKVVRILRLFDFFKQLVPVAASLCYSRKFNEIFCIYNNKAKNKFITPYKIS